MNFGTGIMICQRFPLGWKRSMNILKNKEQTGQPGNQGMKSYFLLSEIMLRRAFHSN